MKPNTEAGLVSSAELFHTLALHRTFRIPEVKTLVANWVDERRKDTEAFLKDLSFTDDTMPDVTLVGDVLLDINMSAHPWLNYLSVSKAVTSAGIAVPDSMLALAEEIVVLINNNSGFTATPTFLPYLRQYINKSVLSGDDRLGSIKGEFTLIFGFTKDIPNFLSGLGD